MNLNFYSTKDYDNKTRFPAPGKQTQFKPNNQSSIINNHLSPLPLNLGDPTLTSLGLAFSANSRIAFGPEGSGCQYFWRVWDFLPGIRLDLLFAVN